MADSPTITVLNNGPLQVTGSVTIVTETGRVLHTDGETWLCRCGGSSSKPFCDGTHNHNGFVWNESELGDAGGDEEFVSVARADQVAEGALMGVEVNGKPVVIGRIGGEICAIGGICSHEYARLEEGDLEGDTVLCPLHNSGFSIRTGAARGLPATVPVPAYDVEVKDGDVLVRREPRA